MHTHEDIHSIERCHPARRGPRLPRLPRLRAHLLARIHRRFHATTQALQIGHLTLPFTRIANPDHVLDQVVEAEDRREKLSGQRTSSDELHLPYWAELWDSSLGLGAFLAEQTRATTQNRRLGSWDPTSDVLDLGCGMGLSGLVAAALGARVTLADLEAPALLLARLNTLPFAPRVRVRKLDWRRDRLDERFALILGADVLYERAQWEFLEPFWRAHLAPTGSVLLGEPGRQTGDLFPEWVVARGWSLERFDQSIPTRKKPVRVYVLREAR